MQVEAEGWYYRGCTVICTCLTSGKFFLFSFYCLILNILNPLYSYWSIGPPTAFSSGLCSWQSPLVVLMPILWCSSVTVLLQDFFGHPLFLFPCGFHTRDCRVMFVGFLECVQSIAISFVWRFFFFCFNLLLLCALPQIFVDGFVWCSFWFSLMYPKRTVLNFTYCICFSGKRIWLFWYTHSADFEVSK